MQIFYSSNDAKLAVYWEDQLEALCEFYTEVLNRFGCNVSRSE